MLKSNRVQAVPKELRKYEFVRTENVIELMKNKDWIDTHRYGTMADINAGEIGRLGDIHYIEKND